MSKNLTEQRRSKQPKATNASRAEVARATVAWPNWRHKIRLKRFKFQILQRTHPIGYQCGLEGGAYQTVLSVRARGFLRLQKSTLHRRRLRKRMPRLDSLFAVFVMRTFVLILRAIEQLINDLVSLHHVQVYLDSKLLRIEPR